MLSNRVAGNSTLISAGHLFQNALNPGALVEGDGNLFGADLGLADLDEEILIAEGCLGGDQSKGDIGFEEWGGGAGGD